MNADGRKLIFFDIDGTILTENGFLPPSAVKAIRDARARGIFTLINTGRTAMNVDPFLREIGFDGYIYGCGTELEYQGTILLHQTQTPECSREMVRLVRLSRVAALYECSDAIYYDPQARMLPGLSGLLSHYQKKQTFCHPVPPPQDTQWCFDKFVIWYDDSSDLSLFQNGINGKFDNIDRGNQFAEMTPCGFSKATGMQKMLELLHADAANAFAIGDSLNDRPMLELAGTGIAMGDGTLLHPYADYITADLKCDGLAKALAHYGLASFP